LENHVEKEAKALLEELKVVFGVKTNVAVIKSALKLSRYMVSQADDDYAVIIENKNNERTKLFLAS